MDVDKQSWNSTLVKNYDENKTYILVKLSESFSNAIQEYSAGQLSSSYSSLSSSPVITIKFHGTRGAIKFPNGKSYDFSLEQSDYSVECIKQVRSRWESVGNMAFCLHVKGKDDVYQRTRTKMEAAEQEKRKFCTKLLGSPKHNSKSSSSSSSSSAVAASTKKSKLSLLDSAPSNNKSLEAKQSSLLSSSSYTSSSTTNHNNNNNINNINNVSVIPNKYPDIHDVKQMRKYKADFDQDYKEYQSLHNYLHRIEERFKSLRESLRQSIEGTPEWESAKERIFNEYEQVKGDSNFHRARSKYKQLHKKLAHIKEKIFQFKRQQRLKNDSSSSIGHKKLKKS